MGIEKELEKKFKDIHYRKDNVSLLTERIRLLVERLNIKEINTIHIVGIGSDKVLMDCIGPFTNTLLKEKLRNNKENDITLNFIGELGNTCNKLNYNDCREIYYEQYLNKDTDITIAIDACLTVNNKEFGTINVDDYPITPAKGVGETLKSIGDIGIRAMVVSNSYELFSLKMLTKEGLSPIYNLCNFIAEGIYQYIISLK